MHYTIINEICTNKPHCLRRSEMIGGNGGQTNLYIDLINHNLLLELFFLMGFYILLYIVIQVLVYIPSVPSY